MVLAMANPQQGCFRRKRPSQQQKSGQVGYAGFVVGELASGDEGATEGADPCGQEKALGLTPFADVDGMTRDEFRTRIRPCGRGLIAVANAGKDDNTFQFLFILGSTSELQGKHAIFGKVTGETIYNMLTLEKAPVDE
ncbi:PREDICTED: peptidyl-prolyl cis-trans isomerase CWC27 homolog, partial [Eufriesea mexicana]|uniref:peptidyl-prolyl cis-trans isomerase CWC27 homolog n=1 Tax=Eufriesea mexicana TaxID=516756 RepID=UPI00083C5283